MKRWTPPGALPPIPGQFVDEDRPAIWDNERSRQFVARLEFRWTDLGDLGEDLARHPSSGEEAARFAERLCEGLTEQRVEGRFDWRFYEREEIPYRVTKLMHDCQKPFHLWNVDRVEDEYPYELEQGPELQVGGAAVLPPEAQVPRAIPKATQALADWIEDQEFREMLVKNDKRNFRRMLREPLPYGKPDEEEEGQPLPAASGGFGGGLGGGLGGGSGGGFSFGAPSQPNEPPPAAEPPASGGFSGGFGGGPPGGLPPGIRLPPHIEEMLRRKREEQERGDD